MTIQPRRPMNMMRPTALSTNALGMSYHAPSRSLTIEESTLRANRKAPGQVYNDACDEGFTLISHRTGNEVIVAMHEIKRDHDGDVQAWIYKSVWPRDANITLMVFND